MRGAPQRPAALAALALAAAALPAAAGAQRLGQAVDADVSWMRVILALAICVALAIAAAWLLRTRLGGRLPSLKPSLGAAPRRLQLLHSLRLSHQVDICLLQCDERCYLVAATPQGALVIDGALPAPASPGAPTP